MVIDTLQEQDASGFSNPGAAAKTYLESRGWRFSAWTHPTPAPAQGGDQIAAASKNGVTMLISYTLLTFQVGATLPCLPGESLPFG